MAGLPGPSARAQAADPAALRLMPASPEPCRSVIEVPLGEIAASADTQMRVVGIDPGTVAAYAEDMKAGATFPAIRVYHDGGEYHLAGGFHRVEAARQIGLGTILAEVLQGTSRDATLAACAANATHGLRRTNEDKRRAITAMLQDPEWAAWSDRQIAKACKVDHKSVAKVRRELTEPRGDFPTRTSPSGKPNGAAGNGEIPTGSMVERLLVTVPTEALIAECKRRGIEVRDA